MLARPKIGSAAFCLALWTLALDHGRQSRDAGLVSLDPAARSPNCPPTRLTCVLLFADPNPCDVTPIGLYVLGATRLPSGGRAMHLTCSDQFTVWSIPQNLGLPS